MIICWLQYRIMLLVVYKFMDAPVGSFREKLLDWMASEIVKYEERYYPIG
jgi:hypothetical protein